MEVQPTCFLLPMKLYVLLLMVHFLVYQANQMLVPYPASSDAIVPWRRKGIKPVSYSPVYSTDGNRQRRLYNWLYSLNAKQQLNDSSQSMIVYRVSNGCGFGNVIRGLVTSMLLVILYNTTFRSVIIQHHIILS